jgi:hypothetical protein
MKYFRFIIVIMLTILICNGCNSNHSESCFSPSPTPSNTSQQTDGVTRLTYEKSDLVALNSQITLEQLKSYLSNGIEYATKDLGDNYYMSIAEVPEIEEYQYKDMGIQLLFKSVYENGVQNGYISAIECDPEIFGLKGIKNGMNFEEIQKCLAPCEITQVEYGLSGIISFELRYEINGVKIIFYAWDEKGEKSFHINIVKDFGKEDKYIRITIGQLESLFSTPKYQYVKNYGNDFVYHEKSNEYEYRDIKLIFDGENLEEISLPANYEIEGARWGMEFNSLIYILGVNTVQRSEGEDGPFYTLTYEYNNFKLYYFAEFSDARPFQYILRK